MILIRIDGARVVLLGVELLEIGNEINFAVQVELLRILEILLWTVVFVEIDLARDLAGLFLRCECLRLDRGHFRLLGCLLVCRQLAAVQLCFFVLLVGEGTVHFGFGLLDGRPRQLFLLLQLLLFEAFLGLLNLELLSLLPRQLVFALLSCARGVLRDQFERLPLFSADLSKFLLFLLLDLRVETRARAGLLLGLCSFEHTQLDAFVL